MYLAIISLITGLAISAVAIYYSVVGLAAIFAAAVIPIMVMGVTLEVAKLVATVWLKQNWKVAPFLIKSYLVTAVCVLMFITSMGIFGFLSKAHSDQSLVSGDVQSKIALYDEKIKIERENIDNAQSVIKQMDAAVTGVITTGDQEVKLRDGTTQVRSAAERSLQIRRSQATDRNKLTKEIELAQTRIIQLQEESAPIRAEVRKVEAEVGPIKYIAAFVYGDNPDANLLEKAVTWVIVIIVLVFDPLAVALLLAAQYSFAQRGIMVGNGGDQPVPEKTIFAEKIAKRLRSLRQYFSNSVDTIKSSLTALDRDLVKNTVLEPIVEAVTVDETPVMPLDEMKEKLSKFVEVVRPVQFDSNIAPISGFDIPKIQSAIVHDTLPETTTQFSKPSEVAVIEPVVVEPVVETVAEEVAATEIDEVPFGKSVDEWNKLIEEAEKAVESEFNYPENPKRGQRVVIVIDGHERNTIFNGETWINADQSDPTIVHGLDDEFSKYKLLHELRDHAGTYVQNEEQQQSGLWNEIRDGLSQEDYQSKAQENQQKGSNVGEDNTNKSA